MTAEIGSTTAESCPKKAAPPPHAQRAQRQGNGRPFRKILDTHSDGQGDGCRDGRPFDAGSHRAESYPDGQAFGNVVQGDGQDEQRSAVQRGGCSVRRTVRHVGVQVRGEPVERIEEQGAPQESHCRGKPCVGAEQARHFHCRGEQRKESGGQHHSAGKSEHDVHRAAFDFAEEKHQSGSQSGHAPGKERSEERLYRRGKLGEKFGERLVHK